MSKPRKLRSIHGNLHGNRLLLVVIQARNEQLERDLEAAHTATREAHATALEEKRNFQLLQEQVAARQGRVGLWRGKYLRALEDPFFRMNFDVAVLVEETTFDQGVKQGMVETGLTLIHAV